VICNLALLLPRAGVAWCGPLVEEKVDHAGARFRAVHATPKQLQVVWKNPDGVPYRSFDQVQAAFSKQGKTITFLMNAGIFEPGGIPSGLHVENRRELHALNLADALGNFFLKLGCNNALFLDGDISQSAVNPTKPIQSNHFGAIFAGHLY